MNTFFPDPYFGWLFYGVLVLFLLAASYTDLRWIVIPKWVSLSALAAGVLFNLLRGGWLGAEEQAVWQFAAHGPILGALDGLLFALAGFAAGFALFLVLWLLGICGGGDVKIFAAIGAWVGPYHVLWLLFGSSLVMVAFSFVRLVLAFLSGGNQATRAFSAKHGKVQDGMKRPYNRLSTYSLPLAIATSLMMLWFYRYELQLAVPMTANVIHTEGVRGHGQ